MKRSIKLNATLNVISTILSVIFPLITFPCVSRIFGVEELGRYNYAKNYVEIFSTFAMLGIPSYGIREIARVRDNRAEASRVSSELFTINIYSNIIALVVLFLSIGISSALSRYISLIMIFSITIPMTTLGLSWIFAAYEDYVFGTIMQIVSNCLSIAAMFLLVKDSSDVYVYAIITVVASVGVNIIRFFYCQRYCTIKLVKIINLSTHWKPVLLLFSSYLAVMVYNKTDTLMLGLIKSDYEVGIYSVSTKIYNLVKSCILALSNVLQARAVVLTTGKDKERKDGFLTKSFGSLLLLVFPCIAGLIILNQDVIRLISGAEYLSAGPSLVILSISMFFATFSTCYSSFVLLPNNLEKYTLYGVIVGALVNLIANFWLILAFAENGAAFTTLLAEMTVFILYLIYGRKYYLPHHMMGTFVKTIISCLAMMGLLWFFNVLWNYSMLLTIAKILIGAAVYFVLQLILRNELMLDYVKEFQNMIDKRILKRRN